MTTTPEPMTTTPGPIEGESVPEPAAVDPTPAGEPVEVAPAAPPPIAPPLAADEVDPFSRPRAASGVRPLLRAGFLLAGGLVWASAVASAIVDAAVGDASAVPLLWGMGAAAIWIGATQVGYPVPARTAGSFLGRALGTLAVGLAVALVYAYPMVRFAGPRNGPVAYLFLGVLGISTVLVARRRPSSPRARRRGTPASHVLAWAAILITSVMLLVPGVAGALLRRLHASAPDRQGARAIDIGQDD